MDSDTQTGGHGVRLFKLMQNQKLTQLQAKTTETPDHDRLHQIHEKYDYIDMMNNPETYSMPTLNETPPGYPMLARFLSSADNLYVYREFRYLQSRSLLYMQDELRSLETQLYRMDQYDLQNRPDILGSRDADDMSFGERKMLMSCIRRKLMEYGQFLTMSHRLAGLSRPSSFELYNIENFMKEKSPLYSHEVYHKNKSDLVVLTPPGDGAVFDEFVLKTITKYQSGPFKSYHMYSAKKLLILKTAILIVALLTLLSAPLYPLYWWSQSPMTSWIMMKIMGLQCSCTLGFGIVLSLCTTAKRHEVCMAAASYMAVLIVFMSQSSVERSAGGSS